MEKTVKTISFQTLGCKLNQYDTQVLIESFTRSPHYNIVEAYQPADICVINTCTVTAKTDRQSRNLIRRAARKNPKALVVVTGCFAQVSPQEVSSIEGVDLIIPNSTRWEEFENSFGVKVERSIHGFRNHTRAFIKVQEGCSNSCSYCVVAAARGEERARPSDEIVEEAKHLVGHGYKEAVLTGTDLGRYEDKDGEDLAGLVRRLACIEGLERIRLSSIHPDRIGEPLLALFSSSSKLCPHVHLSIQSADNRILRAMKRSYARRDCTHAVKRLLEVSPDIAIGADLIVGFPGEDEAAFNSSLEFVEELGLAYLHVFPYSARRGTEASLMSDQIDPELKKARAARLRSLGELKWLGYRRRFLGRTLDCLVESRKKEERLVGLSGNYLHVAFDGEDGMKNTIVHVEILSADRSGTYGRLVGGGGEG